jgi:hypothetical protein
LERQIDKFVTYYRIIQEVEMEREGIDKDSNFEDAAVKNKLKTLPSKILIKAIKTEAKTKKQQKKKIEDEKKERDERLRK